AHVLDVDGLDRPGEGHVGAGLQRVRVFAAEPGDQALFTGLDEMNRRNTEPQHCDNANADREPALAARQLRQAEIGAAGAAAPAARTFGPALFENVLYACRPARVVARRKPRIARPAWAVTLWIAHFVFGPFRILA